MFFLPRMPGTKVPRELSNNMLYVHRLDVFEVTAPTMGDIQSIKLNLEGNDGWNVVKVRISLT